MTASEFAFLALGLVLGVASGAALLEVIRARPSPPREIRLTVTPDSIPRRPSATLSAPAFSAPLAQPAPGGPADPAAFLAAAAKPIEETGDEAKPSTRANEPAVDERTPVLSDREVEGAAAPKGDRSPASPRGPMVGIPIRPEADSFMTALLKWGGRQGASSHGTGGSSTAILPTPQSPRLRPSAARGRSSLSPGAARSDASGSSFRGAFESHRAELVGGPSSGTRSEHTATQLPGPSSFGSSGALSAQNALCAEQRKVADDQCETAARAREDAVAAQSRLRETKRAYDDHVTQAETAAATADPRATHAAKDAAQTAFRAARAMARSRQDVEAAAREWLSEVNRINQVARDAASTSMRERDAANTLVTTIERLEVETDAKRITSEAADEACLRARQDLAACEEAVTRSRIATPTPAAPPEAAHGPASSSAFGQVPLGQETPMAPSAASEDAAAARGGVAVTDEPDDRVKVAEDRGDEPAILRLLRGDRATLQSIVSKLSDDPSEQRIWQVRLGNLIDAIVTRAIEESALQFPIDHPFWGLFTTAEHREIAAALSSLGFRFDGRGGFLDDRVPTSRDLSLAIGYAGLDPMRIRRWPNESDMSELLRQVTVAADEYLAGAASELTLGEMVSLLGRRADDLADLWNAWGRLRPILLEPA